MRSASEMTFRNIISINLITRWYTVWRPRLYYMLVLVVFLNIPVLLLLAGPYWSSWQQWSHCSGSCGSGVKIRVRNCVPSTHGVNNCQGDAVEKQTCQHQSDCPCKKEFFFHFIRKLIRPQICFHCAFNLFIYWTPKDTPTTLDLIFIALLLCRSNLFIPENIPDIHPTDTLNVLRVQISRKALS